MKRRKWITWLSVAIVVVVAIVVGFLVFKTKNASRASNNTIGKTEPFLTYVVKKENMGDFLSLIGQVSANTQNVYAKVSGEIIDLYVQKGQRVKKGEMLAKVDDSQYQLQYLKALNVYNNSLGQAPATVKENKLSMEIAKKNLDETEIRAPISGIVENLNVATGDRVGQNSVLTTIVDDSDMEVDANIDEIDLSKVKVGQKAEMIFDQLNNVKINGHVSFINPSAVNSGGLTVIPIELSFDKDPRSYGVINGIDCTVNISLMNGSDVIAVPNKLIQHDEKGEYVLVKTDSGNKKTYVKIGQQTARMSEIISGLKEGDILIIKINGNSTWKTPAKEISVKKIPIPGVGNKKMPKR